MHSTYIHQASITYIRSFKVTDLTLSLQMARSQVGLALFILLVATQKSFGHPFWDSPFILQQSTSVADGDLQSNLIRRFKPMKGVTVIGSCDWEIRATQMKNRIPHLISETICRSRSSNCGGNPFFQVCFN